MSKPLPPSRTAPQFVVRFPDEGMRDRIAEAAKANNRSMNAEIVARLEGSFRGASALTDAGYPHHPVDPELVQAAVKVVQELMAKQQAEKESK